MTKHNNRSVESRKEMGMRHFHNKKLNGIEYLTLGGEGVVK